MYMKVFFKENFTSISTVACQEGRTYFKSRRHYYGNRALNSNLLGPHNHMSTLADVVTFQSGTFKNLR